MDFAQLRQLVRKNEDSDFMSASDKMQDVVFSLDRNEVVGLITEIGTIPEDIGHDTSEEKLYAKTSDILFAKALELMDFDVKVLRERADAADIVARSKYHSYSLVGDAKSFRLSRTAKNAKDFKVNTMVAWRGDNDYAVLCCPYYQYPKSKSRIYKEALNGNVMLFSWEWVYIMLSEGIRESARLDLSRLWNQSETIGGHVTVPEQEGCFLAEQDKNICGVTGITEEERDRCFSEIKARLRARGMSEIGYYRSEIERVKRLDRESAIEELLDRMKIGSKIATIEKFVNRI